MDKAQAKGRVEEARGSIKKVTGSVVGQSIHLVSGTIGEGAAERKRAAEELRDSNRRFSDLLANVDLVSLMFDRAGRITYCNDYLLRITGWQREAVLGRDWFELFVPPETVDEMKHLYSALLDDLPVAWHHENAILTRSAERRLIRWNNSVLRSRSGEVIGTASIGEDITERKQHEDKIARLSRIHAVLSGINSAIVRIRDPKELYREACRIAVEEGGLRMAWIGLVNKITLRVVPAAWAGHEGGFLSSVARLSLDENTVEGHGVVGRAIRSKSPVVTDDFASDPQSVCKEETLARGYRAGVVLPLIVGEDVVGVLSLYASEMGFFDDEEVKLLTDLAADISFSMEHIQQEERLHYLACHDALTGLANRSLLQDRLLQAMHFAERFRLNVAVLVVNLDRFKFVNDTLGHAAGDDLLKVAGGRIVACVRDIDTVARFGSDEFVVVLAGTKQEGDSATQIAQRILEAFAEPVLFAGRELFVTCSVGVAIYPRDGEREEVLLKNAAAAMYRAREHGRNNVHFYTPEANARAEERLSLESALRRALERDEFLLHYQPQVDLRTGQIIGLEALIRWERRDLGMVPPARFIPIAEEMGLILPIGEWVLRTAARQNKAWQNEGLAHIRIAVNLSAQQFRQKDLPRRIQRILTDTGLESQYLEVELTESMLMREIESAVDMMSELRRVGVQISLDDFGTGYSSLSYLKRFPIDTLKIDQSFVREITSDPDSAAIADAIIAMAHSLRLTVLAEGLETDGQLAFLRAHHCDQIQGNLFSKPLPTDELAQLFRERRSLPAAASSPARSGWRAHQPSRRAPPRSCRL
jgi:diguanylate cyclase (GGDEF)-like protein/PAS domain S-box-containing protein